MTSTSRQDRTFPDTCSPSVLWRLLFGAILYVNLARMISNGTFQILWTSMLPWVVWAMSGPTPASCAPMQQGTSTTWDCTSRESTIWAAITTPVKSALSNTKPSRIYRSTASYALLSSNIKVKWPSGQVSQIRFQTWWRSTQYLAWTPIASTSASCARMQLGTSTTWGYTLRGGTSWVRVTGASNVVNTAKLKLISLHTTSRPTDRTLVCLVNFVTVIEING